MSYRQLLSRATEGTDAPTPGYLFVDLAKVASGNPTACQDMATYLSRRLASKNNANIKFKCLKVMAKLCDAVGRNQFRRCLAQDHTAVTSIKEAMVFQGAPDPVRGDEPNQKVRIAAKECLDAVYREAPTSEQTTMSSGGQGYGGVSSQYGGPPHNGGGGGGGGGRMQGIGNPMFADPRNAPSNPSGLQGAVKEAGEVLVGMMKDPLARNVKLGGEPPRHSGSYGGPQYGRPPPGQMDLARRTGGQWTMASNRGPGAIDYQRGASNSGVVGGSWANPANNKASAAAPPPPAPMISGPVHAGSAVSDGTYEKNLVKELCPPGGMKPVPPPDKLAAFSRNCSSLNSDLVCPVLLDALEEGQPWIIRAKALCSMEAAIANGGNGTSNPYRDFFYACRDEIAPLASHPRIPISDPAKRVLQLLGFEAAAVAAAPAPVVVAATAPAPNLLDFDNEPAAAPVPPPAAPATNGGGGGGGSMFGGMQVKAVVPAAAAPAPVPVAAAPSLLDFAPTAPPTAAAPSDPFGLAAQQQSQQPASTESMFGQLNVKDEEPPKQAPAAEPASSSAFGFLNAGAAPPAAAPSFDPLKSPPGAPPSPKSKSMQISQEQMQAMAYQQMMYQQMQMAMAMQAMGKQQPNMVFQQQQQQPNMVFQQQQQSPQFSIVPPAQKDDKKFDFVKDAMMGAKK